MTSFLRSGRSPLSVRPLALRALPVVALSAALLAGAPRAEANVRLLPGSSSGAANLKMPGGQAVPSQQISTEGAGVVETQVAGLGSGFRVNFQRQYATVTSRFSSPIDATGYDGIYILVKNVGKTPGRAQITLNSEYMPNAAGLLGDGPGLKPGESRRFVIYFDRGWVGRQMQVMPPALDVPAQIMWGFSWNFDFKKVIGWSMYNSDGAASLELQDLRLVKKRANFNGIVDAYGQDADLDGDWKVKSDGDLLARAAQEATDLATQTDGTLAIGSGPFGTSTATGKWRFERSASGNWFPISPTGKRTWILGLNNVGHGGQSIVEGKEEFYASLPPKEGPYGQFYGRLPYSATGGAGQWLGNYDFYGANLYKKYGANYVNAWRTRQVTRLRKWGINAVADGLDRDLIGTTIPYLRSILVFHYPGKLVVPAPGWAQPNDPFSPDFASWCVSTFKVEYAKEIAAPSNLLGITVGNEDTWGWMRSEKTKYQIPIAAMNAAPTQPCKVPLINVLKAKYTTIAGLNAAWNKSYASWDALLPANALGDPTITAGMRADLSLMLTAYADKNYSTIRASLLKAGYRGLYLGARVALDQTPDEVIAVEAKYVDGHTLNNYEPDDAAWARIAKLTKPTFITEFAVTAVDRGHYMANKSFEVGTQADRAVRVREYLDKAATLKNVVGCFYFGYADCPFTGRWSDDERWNSGVIDMTDTPYQEVISALRGFGDNLPNARKIR